MVFVLTFLYVYFSKKMFNEYMANRNIMNDFSGFHYNNKISKLYSTFNSETVWKFRARHKEIWGQRDPMVTFGHAPTFTGSNAAIVHSYDGENQTGHRRCLK